jgi:hypothetical protein
MKPAWQTIEFWVTIITNLVGLLALTGYITPEQSGELTKSLTAIAGALLSLGVSFGFIKARMQLRVAMMNVLIQASTDTNLQAQLRKV